MFECGVPEPMDVSTRDKLWFGEEQERWYMCPLYCSRWLGSLPDLGPGDVGPEFSLKIPDAQLDSS